MTETVEVSGLYRQCPECNRAMIIGYGVSDPITVIRVDDTTWITPHAQQCPVLAPKPEPMWQMTFEATDVSREAMELILGTTLPTSNKT